MSNVSNNGTRSGSINTTEKTSTNTVGTGIRVGKDSGDSNRGCFLVSITPLPFSSLLRGGSSSGGREVSSGNSESIDRVSNVVHSLEKTISVNVLVRAGCHSVGIAGLSTG